jgi:hypothetical protein
MTVHEDITSCEGCEAEITHIVCGHIPTQAEDSDYYLCDSCIAERDEVEQEPDIDDSVKCCPDCERPNQFGELCASCEQEQSIQAAFLGLRGDE